MFCCDTPLGKIKGEDMEDGREKRKIGNGVPSVGAEGGC